MNSGTVDPAGNPVPETVLEGSGDGTVSSGGKSVTVTWTKGSVNEVLTLATADGATATLAPGVTWIELVPNGIGFRHDELTRPVLPRPRRRPHGSLGHDGLRGESG